MLEYFDRSLHNITNSFAGILFLNLGTYPSRFFTFHLMFKTFSYHGFKVTLSSASKHIH